MFLLAVTTIALASSHYYVVGRLFLRKNDFFLTFLYVRYRFFLLLLQSGVIFQRLSFTSFYRFYSLTQSGNVCYIRNGKLTCTMDDDERMHYDAVADSNDSALAEALGEST